MPNQVCLLSSPNSWPGHTLTYSDLSSQKCLLSWRTSWLSVSQCESLKGTVVKSLLAYPVTARTMVTHHQQATLQCLVTVAAFFKLALNQEGAKLTSVAPGTSLDGWQSPHSPMYCQSTARHGVGGKELLYPAHLQDSRPVVLNLWVETLLANLFLQKIFTLWFITVRKS